jgi:hypothetical protein
VAGDQLDAPIAGAAIGAGDVGFLHGRNYAVSMKGFGHQYTNVSAATINSRA